jgi:hypothetical protein
VLDATFLDSDERAACRALAQATGAAFRILACRAEGHALRQRVVMRRASGRDASEADLAVLARQLAGRNELDAGELADVVVIDTSQPVDARALSAALCVDESAAVGQGKAS